MTREEAITRLKNMAWLYGSTEREQNIEAIDMAISALTEAENGCDGCLYEVSDGSLFPCNICRLNYGCQYEKDDSNNITESPNEVVEKNDEAIDLKGKGTIVTSYRCDKSMKRSKERCQTPYRTRWRCNGVCNNCICCIAKDEYGNESHKGVNTTWKQKNT